MVGDNITRDIEQGHNLIEYEESCSLPIRFNCRHGLDQLSKVVDNDDNVLITLDEVGLQSMKSTPHSVKGPSIITR
jgi:hypothetical protein